MPAVKLFRGDTWQRAWEIKDASGAPVDLTGVKVRLHVRDANGTRVMEAGEGDGKITIQPALGRIDMKIPKEETEVDPGTYRFDLEVTFADGVRRTYEQETLIILEDMTRD